MTSRRRRRHHFFFDEGVMANGMVRRALAICVVGMLAGCGTHEGGGMFGEKVFNVKACGAVGDGKVMDTKALQGAMNACAAAGGGRVEVPAGTYLTGPLELRSHVDLHVEEGAVVQFTKDFYAYPMKVGVYEGLATVVCTSPLWGEGLEDVSITGKGVFDGNGQAWREVNRGKMSDAEWKAFVDSGGYVDERTKTWYPSKAAFDGMAGFRKLRTSDAVPRVEDYKPYRDLLRPVLMELKDSKHIVFEGVTFRNSPNWNLHPYLCQDVALRHVTLFNPGYAQNGDGIDVDSCDGVLIEDCKIDAGDDDICLKSGRNEQGRKLGRPTENVVVRNCEIGTGHGAITIGSEMSGGVRNVKVSHVTANGTDMGLRFKSTRGRGGTVENIEIDDVKMSNMLTAAIDFNMYYMIRSATRQAMPVNEGTPIFRNFKITNVTCESAGTALNIVGLPEMAVEGVTIENADLTGNKAGTMVDGKGITLKNVHIHAKDGGVVSVTNVSGLEMVDVSGVAKP